MMANNQILRGSTYGHTPLFKELSAVFSDDSLLKYFLKVEVELAFVQSELAIIPKDAANEIRRVSQTDFLDYESLFNKSATVGMPIVALVEQLTKAAGVHGKYVHWGATTQDIIDTALVLQLKEAFGAIISEVKQIIKALEYLVETHRDSIMVGRSQLQHGLPITFGFKAALWLSPMLDHLSELIKLKNQFYLQLGGAVGTLASMHKGLETRILLAERLGLKEPKISWHSSREILVEAMHRIAAVSGTLGKIAKDIVLMSQTEVAEVAEKKVAGRGTSSTMPQKRNPISAQGIIVSAKNTGRIMGTLYESLLNDHERGTGVWQLEWLAVPDMVLHAAGGMGLAADLLQNLEVNTQKMKANLMLTNGFVMAESVMMNLAKNMGKQPAHDAILELIEHAQKDNISFKEALIKSELTAQFSNEEIEAWLNPKNYLGESAAMINAVLTRAREINKN